MDGLWKFFYDSATIVKQADVFFNSDKDGSAVYYTKSGGVYRKSSTANEVTTVEEIGPAGNLMRRVEFLYLFVNNKERKILSETRFENEKQVTVVKTPGIARVVFGHDKLFFTGILVLLGCKLLSAFTFFYLSKNENMAGKNDFFINRLFLNLKAVFVIWIKGGEEKYAWTAGVHNVCSVCLFVSFVTYILSHSINW